MRVSEEEHSVRDRVCRHVAVSTCAVDRTLNANYQLSSSPVSWLGIFSHFTCGDTSPQAHHNPVFLAFPRDLSFADELCVCGDHKNVMGRSRDDKTAEGY